MFASDAGAATFSSGAVEVPSFPFLISKWLDLEALNLYWGLVGNIEGNMYVIYIYMDCIGVIFPSLLTTSN